MGNAGVFGGNEGLKLELEGTRNWVVGLEGDVGLEGPGLEGFIKGARFSGLSCPGMRGRVRDDPALGVCCEDANLDCRWAIDGFFDLTGEKGAILTFFNGRASTSFPDSLSSSWFEKSFRFLMFFSISPKSGPAPAATSLSFWKPRNAS